MGVGSTWGKRGEGKVEANTGEKVGEGKEEWRGRERMRGRMRGMGSNSRWSMVGCFSLFVHKRTWGRHSSIIIYPWWNWSNSPSKRPKAEGADRQTIPERYLKVRHFGIENTHFLNRKPSEIFPSVLKSTKYIFQITICQHLNRVYYVMLDIKKYSSKCPCFQNKLIKW